MAHEQTTKNGQSKWLFLYPHLKKIPSALLNVYCAIAAFGLYFCLYAFHRPYTILHYSQVPPWMGCIDYKASLYLFHGLGHMAAKFIGIKFVSEVPRRSMMRFWYLLALVCFSQMGLILFGALPMNWKVLGVFMSG
jgi:hypothetical protein